MSFGLHKMTFRGGPFDGQDMLASNPLPYEMRYNVNGGQCWMHVYTLTGTLETGYYWRYSGQQDTDILHPCDGDGFENIALCRHCGKIPFPFVTTTKQDLNQDWVVVALKHACAEAVYQYGAGNDKVAINVGVAAGLKALAKQKERDDGTE